MKYPKLCMGAIGVLWIAAVVFYTVYGPGR